MAKYCSKYYLAKARTPVWAKGYEDLQREGAAEAEYCEMLSDGGREKQWKTSLAAEVEIVAIANSKNSVARNAIGFGLRTMMQCVSCSLFSRFR